MSSTTFRHTKKALQKIKEAMNEKGFNKTKAILYLIEREIPQLQLEQKTEGDYFSYPPFLFCPSDRKWYAKDSMLTGNCKNCLERKICPAWVI